MAHDTTINRPDPLEPTAATEVQHPLHDELNFSTGQEWHRRLVHHHSQAVRTHVDGSKRRKLDKGSALALPRLPVRDIRRRPRLPPTLSGLHQPPPNAGLLPSISIRDATAIDATIPPQPHNTASSKQVVTPAEKEDRRSSRKRWSAAETDDLMRGVAKFGIGSWTAILKCADYRFSDHRTALDLKDRFRICRPGDYCRAPGHVRARQQGTEEISSTDLTQLGVTSAFKRSSRRGRHGYSHEEDAQLVKGFQRHGSHWSRIQQDSDLCLSHRTRTDLRDRLRNKFPDLFATVNARRTESVSKLSSDAMARTTSTHSATAFVDVPHSTQTKTSGHQHVFDAEWSFDPGDLQDTVTLDRHILSWPLGRPQTVEQSCAMALPSSSSGSHPHQRLRPWHEITQVDVFPESSQTHHHLAIMDDIGKPSHAFLTFDELLS